jgi:6-phosphofructokinase 2
MNPALDITTHADVVRPTSKIRCAGVRYDPGGGGVNVAQVAQNLGATVSAIFPAGGAVGEAYAGILTARGVPFRRVPISGSTRESFTINEVSTGLQYRFVLPGPELTFVEQQQCLAELRDAAVSASFVVASGSLPPGAPVNFYQHVALVCRDLGVRLILDTSGGGLRHVTSGVFLLKASVRELRECVGRELLTEEEQFTAAREIIDCGQARVVVVSLGSKGALLVTSQERLRFNAIPMRAVSGVGAGDAMVAAIAVGLSRDWSLRESVRFGIAAGAAMLMTPGTEPCDRA